MHTISAQSSFRDRTHEFQSIAERLKKTGSAPNGQSSSSSRSEEQQAAIANQSEFNKRASKIGLGIHQTSQKLTKLAKWFSANENVLFTKVTEVSILMVLPDIAKILSS